MMKDDDKSDKQKEVLTSLNSKASRLMQASFESKNWYRKQSYIQREFYQRVTISLK
jgi:hypothetical protein